MFERKKYIFHSDRVPKYFEISLLTRIHGGFCYIHKVWRKYVHEVLVNRLGGLSLPRKSVVRLTDRPDMTLDVYRGRKTTIQHSQQGVQYKGD